jgi:starch-binding outer membrane protein, SusD/RagB family
MIKSIKYISFLFVLLQFTSCDDHFLDLSPRRLLTDKQVFNNESTLQAYFATLYQGLPIEDFNFTKGEFNTYPGDGNSCAAAWAGETWGNAYGGLANTWSPVYKNIRNINELISGLDSLSTLNDSIKKTYKSEAYFLRAFSYFYLVKTWGGVPILRKAQAFKENVAELMLPRNQEEEVWDFILSDLDSAALHLGTTKIYGRVNKYVALAYKSKVALFAASAAKYGVVDKVHFVGVNPARATEFYTKCMDAAEQLMNSGSYSLYDAIADRSQNFQMSFLNTATSPEVLWAKGFDYNATKHTHSWDYLILPYQLKPDFGEKMSPYLQSVEAFEFADGKPGTAIFGASVAGVPVVSATLATVEAAFAGRDPRLFASIITPNDVVKGVKITVQKGVRIGTTNYTGNNYGQLFDKVTKTFVSTPNDSTIMGTGASGGCDILNCKTGFFLKKYLDVNREKSMCKDWMSETDFIVMRYAEVLLNYVEATIETQSRLDKGLQCINLVKKRAGVKEFATVAELTKVRYRAERRSEFFAEGQLFWDLRRWRELRSNFLVGSKPESNIRHGLEIWFDYTKNKYFMQRKNQRGISYLEDRIQYDGLPSAELAINPLFIDNPGY